MQLIWDKDSANRRQYKTNSFVFIVECSLFYIKYDEYTCHATLMTEETFWQQAQGLDFRFDDASSDT